MANAQYPSLKGLHCPNCNGTELKYLGTKGSVGKAVGAAMFGAIGNLIQSSQAKNNFEVVPIRCQCQNCKKKFEAEPLVAAEDEILDAPCTVVLHRKGSFVGSMVVQQVFLNGVKVGSVKNKEELKFETYTKHNVIFVTDHNGMAFPGEYTFTAESGGTETIEFKRGFI